MCNYIIVCTFICDVCLKDRFKPFNHLNLTFEIHIYIYSKV